MKWSIFLISLFISCSIAYASPLPWQMTFQEPASAVMKGIVHLHDHIVFPIILFIVSFVLLLLLYIIIRFNKKNNPEPSKTSHNTPLEVIWTAIPILIIIVILIPSLKLLYLEEKIPPAEMTLKVTGYQWYWGYEYPEQAITFYSNLKQEDTLKKEEKRLFTTDNVVVLPINTNIRVQMTSSDVIHSWAIPALGVKRDAVPGRLNETFVNITKPGIYYGQCSELCGMNHGFMPIMVKAVSKQDFTQWLKKAKKQFS